MPKEFHENGKKLKQALETIQRAIGKPITISCAYRSPEHNIIAGSKAHTSQHLFGIAADIQNPDGLNSKELKKKIVDLIEKNEIPAGGIGLYDWGTHYDIRGKNERWP